MASGALLASLGALMVVWLVGAAGQRQEVLVVRQQVPYGSVVTDEDLGVARISLDPGIRSVPTTDRGLVVGQVASTRLVPGMVLAPGMVEPEGEPVAGRVLVPLALATERMPAGGLRAGDRILVIDTGAPGSFPLGGAAAGSAAEGGAAAGSAATGEGSGAMGAGLVRWVPAVVVRIGPIDVNGIVVVDVTVPAPDGPALAAAAAHGQVALVVQPMGG